jgi:hypothetical protein
MSKLTDTQAIILSAACQRPDGNLLPLPGSLRGGAATKVVTALLARGLAEERVLDTTTKADLALNTIWHNVDDGRAILLRITPVGLAAVGIDQDAGKSAPAATASDVTDRFSEDTNSAGEPAVGAQAAFNATAADAAKKRGRPRTTTEPVETPKRGRSKKATEASGPRKTRDDTKQAQLIAMLRRKEGATIAQIVAATGWQPHTVRGAFAGALKKRLGLEVSSEKVESRGRVYRIAG